MSGHVFISYSHASDAAYVERLAAHLTSAGVLVWFDQQIINGDRWSRVIQDQIDTCAAFIVVMSPGGAESTWVDREIDQAEIRRKPIFPLLLSGERFFRLAHLQFEDVTGDRMPSTRYVAQLPKPPAVPPPVAPRGTGSTSRSDAPPPLAPAELAREAAAQSKIQQMVASERLFPAVSHTRHRGRVKWFNAEKGFGFITSEAGMDYFAHYSWIISGSGYRELVENEEVMFTIGEGKKGPAAIAIVCLSR